MTYDVTNPYAPVFVRLREQSGLLGRRRTTRRPPADLGPEGVMFIDAKDSPTRTPLLVVANEVSGTVTLYKVERE